MKDIDAAYGYISGLLSGPLSKPQVGVICGSALNDLGKHMEEPITIPYSHIPGFPRSNVAGHLNVVRIGRINGVVCIIFFGRFHGYEGLPMRASGLIVRLMAKIGVPNLIVTNSVGSCGKELCQIGDFLVAEDHISFPSLSGFNPLVGPNLNEFGGRFINVETCYHPESYQMVMEAALKANIAEDAVKQGVYAHVSGPVHPTNAECKFLRSIGCAAVGTGTVPEVLTAAHCKQIQKTVVVSLITNQPAFRGSKRTSQEEGRVVAQARAPEYQRLVKELVPILCKRERPRTSINDDSE